MVDFRGKEGGVHYGKEFIFFGLKTGVLYFIVGETLKAMIL